MTTTPEPSLGVGPICKPFNRDGALKLKEQIEDYWLARGHVVSIRILGHEDLDSPPEKFYRVTARAVEALQGAAQHGLFEAGPDCDARTSRAATEADYRNGLAREDAA